MSITPAFLDELRSRVPISQLVGRFVSWDQRKSQPAKGDFWAPCPFHSEKTASFHVQDDKGFYYCFGCQAKGDAVGFLKEKANMSFVEAVRELAGIAGMQMPEYRPEQKEMHDQNAKLIEMHEEARKFFTKNLSTSAGTMARDYLTKERGLKDQTLQDFGVGYAANSRDALLSMLKEKGYSIEEMALGGLVIKPDDGGQAYDRFRNRIMFPISDLRGRTVAFGGRAMEANARAKYLNSPESPIFHKSNVVYNLNRARNHVKDAAHIIIAEGYMDVIALAQAGFAHSVAPMGTAITIEQIQAIWRIDPRPIAALDGDAAGQRAAKKLSLLALPHISADKTLRFVMMPEGLDPDEFITKKGKPAMAELLAGAIPMVEMLWRGALEDKHDDTPEARTQFDKILRGLLNTITDPALRKHYADDFAGRRTALFQKPIQQQYAKPNQYQGNYKPSSKTPPRPRVHTSSHSEADLALALVLKSLLAHPTLASEFIDELASMPAQDSDLDKLRNALLLNFDDQTAIEALSNDAKALDKYKRLNGLAMTSPATDINQVRTALHKELERTTHEKALESEIEEIRARIATEGVTEELSDLLSKLMNEKTKMREERVKEEPNNSDSASYLRHFLESEGWHK